MSNDCYHKMYYDLGVLYILVFCYYYNHVGLIVDHYNEVPNQLRWLMHDLGGYFGLDGQNQICCI